jgi:hypothetical protein
MPARPTNGATAQIRTGHLMVRDASEWDALAQALTIAYDTESPG